jgi:hypothetical protein
VRVLLTCARRAGFRFEEAWDLAASTSLAYMSDRRAEECWDALARDRAAWADAYVDATQATGTANQAAKSARQRSIKR